MSETAAAQLRRVLELVPHVADGERHPIADLARRLGIDERTLMRDIDTLGDRFDDPGAFVERLRIYKEPTHVQVESDPFRRPMRLSVAELRALELGLTMLCAERPPDEQAAIEGARARLRSVLAVLPGRDPADAIDADGALDASAGDALDDAQRATLALLRAARLAHRKVRLAYRKADAAASSERLVCPYALVVGSGHWYLIAMCETSAGLRVFRVDRIAGAAVVDERYDVPDTFDVREVIGGGRAFHVAEGEPETLVVRYGPAIARWIAEREKREPDADGSITVSHPLADVAWAVRHVLQYGADAEVLAPAHVRAALAERLEAMRGRCAPTVRPPS